jgi:hypothetical protein
MSDTAKNEEGISANAMMAYVRVTMKSRDYTETLADKAEHKRTFRWHVFFIALGIAITIAAVAMGLDIYWATLFGGIPQAAAELNDLVKRIG